LEEQDTTPWWIDLRPTLLAFVHFFLVISSYYVIKPVRDALFVKSIGPDRMPYYYLLVAGVVFVVVWGYNALLRRVDSRRFVVALQSVVVINLLVFWWLMSRGVSLSSAFYTWASVYNVLVVTLFWSLTNDLFDASQGRRHYGVIGGGGIVGGIVGSLAARYLPLWVGTTSCLLVGAGLMALAVGVTLARLRGAPPRAAESDAGGAGAGSWRDMLLVLTDRQARFIGAVVLFVTLGKTIFNYHYYHLVDATVSGTDRATSFFGTVNAATNITSAVLQFLVTTWVLRRMGARAGLLFLPGALFAAMGAMLTAPVLALAAALNVGQQSITYSINQSSKELLYTPCSEAIKYRAKAVIDMFVFRLGDATAALALLLLHATLGLPPWTSLALGLACTVGWLVMVLRYRDPTV